MTAVYWWSKPPAYPKFKKKFIVKVWVLYPHVCLHAWYPKTPEEGVGSLGAGFTGSCEPSEVGAGNCFSLLQK